MTTIMQINT